MRTAIASDEQQLVPLQGGPSVPLSVVVWLIDATFRGLTVRHEPDGQLFAGPRAAVTSADVAFLREHKTHLIAAVDYMDAAEARPA